MSTKNRIIGAFAGAALAGLALLGAPTPAFAESKDVITFKNGKVVEGRVLEETATTVRMMVSVGGIEAEATYNKSEIIEVKRGEAAAAPAAKPAAGAPSSAQPIKASKEEPGAGAGAKKVYTIELTGWFGEDISQTPIRNAVKEAKKLGADYIIFVLDNDWSLRRFGSLDEIKDDQGQFDQLFRSEEMETTFTEEIQHEWTAQPQVVFWVKKAMGGAAFLPFNAKTIYFASEGKMGGIGKLEKVLGQMGDLVFREKQFSLRLGHAEGRAIQGGYAPEIIRAMARTEYVLSYRVVGGKPEFLTHMPEGDDEFLLTDDGEEQSGNKDTEEQLGRDEGNDCLTLNAKLAYDLGISKGTVDSLDDLLFQLGIARNHVKLKTQSEQIMKGWRDGLASAKRQLPKLWKEFNDVQVKEPGGYTQRNQARGKKKSIIDQMQSLEKRYQEALNPHQIPPSGVPDWNELEDLRKRIDLEQLADKPEKR